MFAGWGSRVARLRWPVLSIALIAVIGAGIWGFGVFGKLTEGGYSDPRSESARGGEVVAAALGGQSGDVIAIYTPDQGTIDDAALTKRIKERLAALPESAVRAQNSYWEDKAARFAAEDKSSAVAVITLAGADDAEKTDAYAEIEDDLTVPGARLQVAGGIPLGYASSARSTDDLAFAEMISLPIVLVLLLFIFGSLVAAALPVLVGGASVLGSLGVLHVIAQNHEVNSFAVNVASLLGLGMAIDYGLFMVGRFREEQAHHATAEAVRRTVATAGRTVVFSATLLMIALAGLLLFPQGFLKSLAYGGLAAVFLAMLLSLTLLPALLAVLGPGVDKLPVRLPGRGDGSGAGWNRLAAVVLRRPLLFALPILALLLLLALPITGVRFGENDERVLPAGDPSRVAIETLKADYPQFSTDGVQIVVRGTDGRKPDVRALTEAAGKVPGVSGVTAAGASKDVVVLTAALTNPDSFSADARNVVDDLRALAPPKSAEVLISGVTARNVDSLTAIEARLPLMIGLLVGATLLLMFLAFGSILLPIKAVVMSALSLTATFGILIWIFQDGHGAGLLDITPAPLEAGIVVLMAAVVFGLSTDYEVFLLSRMVEARLKGATSAEAITIGLTRTGRVISAAALLLIVVTGAFALSSVTTMRFVGVGMIVALLLDATVVRMLLVPSVLTLFGDAAWWAPGPLRRLQERAGLAEHAGEEDPTDRHAAPAEAPALAYAGAPPRPALVGAGAPLDSGSLPASLHPGIVDTTAPLELAAGHTTARLEPVATPKGVQRESGSPEADPDLSPADPAQVHAPAHAAEPEGQSAAPSTEPAEHSPAPSTEPDEPHADPTSPTHPFPAAEDASHTVVLDYAAVLEHIAAQETAGEAANGRVPAHPTPSDATAVLPLVTLAGSTAHSTPTRAEVTDPPPRTESVTTDEEVPAPEVSMSAPDDPAPSPEAAARRDVPTSLHEPVGPDVLGGAPVAPETKSAVLGNGPAVLGEGPAVLGEGPAVLGEGPAVLGEGPIEAARTPADQADSSAESVSIVGSTDPQKPAEPNLIHDASASASAPVSASAPAATGSDAIWAEVEATLAAGAEAAKATPPSADQFTADPLPADQLSAEQLSAEQLSAEQLSAEQRSVDQFTADKPSADQLLADRLSADKTSTDPLHAVVKIPDSPASTFNEPNPTSPPDVEAEVVDSVEATHDAKSTAVDNQDAIDVDKVNIDAVNVDAVNAEPVNAGPVNVEAVNVKAQDVNVDANNVNAEIEGADIALEPVNGDARDAKAETDIQVRDDAGEEVEQVRFAGETQPAEVASQADATSEDPASVPAKNGFTAPTPVLTPDLFAWRADPRLAGVISPGAEAAPPDAFPWLPTKTVTVAAVNEQSSPAPEDKPAGAPLGDRPADTARDEEPSTLAPLDQPNVATTIDAPGSNAPADKPNATTVVDEPSVAVPADEPRSAPADQTDKTAPPDQPADRPSGTAPTDQPTSTTPADPPTDRPSGTAPTDQPRTPEPAPTSRKPAPDATPPVHRPQTLDDWLAGKPPTPTRPQTLDEWLSGPPAPTATPRPTRPQTLDEWLNGAAPVSADPPAHRPQTLDDWLSGSKPPASRPASLADLPDRPTPEAVPETTPDPEDEHPDRARDA